MAHRFPPTRFDAPICFGVLVAANTWGLEAVLPNLLPSVLAALVGGPTNDAAAEGNDRRVDKHLKQLKSLILVGQQVDGGPLGILVGYLADVLVAAYGNWRKGSNQIPVAQLERPVDLVIGYLEVVKLSSLPYGANVAVQDSLLECDTSVVLSLV